MDLNRIYKNKNLEKKRKALLEAQSFARSLVAYKPKRGRARIAIEEAFELVKSGWERRFHGQDKLSEHFCALIKELPPCNRQFFYDLLIAVETESDFFDDKNPRGSYDIIDGLADIAKWGDFWIRQPNAWKTRSHNTYRQFKSLLRHLFAKYDVPAFMDSCWLANRREPGRAHEPVTDYRVHQEWFIHIGSGQNIRTAYKPPFPLSKKAAHHFLEAPSGFSIPNAFRYGQIVALGGNEPLVRAVNGSFLGTNFKNHDFWESVFRFFIENPMLDRDQVAPIIDYIQNQKFSDRIEIVNGVTVNHGAPQPGFCMKKREPIALLDQVDKWHNELARSKKFFGVEWKPCGIAGMSVEEGADHNKKIFTIEELTSGKALKEEGRLMHHCVASYAPACSEGRSAIFALNMMQFGQLNKMVTIRVSLAGPRIEEVRGKYNERPSVIAARMVNLWATKCKLQVSSYAYI